ncbi:MAG: MarR family transcriptional regulator [Proteobacteria bacterium]|nr:MarR family transcriptional regulator [Pseudomonadota bacterium]
MSSAPPPKMPGLEKTPWARPRFKNWLAVARCHALYAQRLQLILAPLGLRIAQFDVLANLVYEPGMTQQRLAGKLFVGRSNLSMALSEMEKMGWVRRESDPQDKRIRRLFLTPQGQALALQALEDECVLFDEMMTALSEEECNALGDSMRRLGDYLKSGLPPKEG